MKQGLAKILTAILLLNLFAFSGVSAQEPSVLYINGAAVNFTEGADGAPMIGLAELAALGLSYTHIENGVSITDGERTASLFAESSVVLVDGESAPYANAVSASGGQVESVSAWLLCDLFGLACPEQGVAAAQNTAVASSVEETVSGNIVLPEGFSLKGRVYITVMLRSATFPYAVEASTVVRMGSWQTSAGFTLTMPNDMEKGIWLSYQIYSDVSGIYEMGYYAAAGTTIDRAQADVLTSGASGLEFPLVATSPVQAEVLMPGGRSAAGDIRATVYVVPNITMGTGSSYTISSDGGVVITQGADSGNVTFDLPVQDNVQYKLGLRFMTGDDTVYNTVYYQEGGATSSRQLAAYVTDQSGGISLPLIEKRRISGVVEHAAQACEIIAIGQDESGVYKDIDDAVFYTKAYSSAQTGAFELEIPADITDYILGIKYIAADMTYLQYYSENGLVKNIQDADVVHAGSDVSGLVIDASSTYTGTPVRLLGYTLESGGTFQIGYENTSGVQQAGVTAFAAYYGSNNRLLGVSKVTTDIAANQSGTLQFSTAPAGGQTIAQAKVFIWDDALTPVSDVKQIDWSIDTQRYAGLYVNNEKCSVSPDDFFYTCGALMASKELAAESLGLSVSAEGGTVTFAKNADRVTLTCGSLTAEVNGEPVMMEAMPMQAGQTVMVPLLSVAEFFGYTNNYYNQTSQCLYLAEHK